MKVREISAMELCNLAEEKGFEIPEKFRKAIVSR